MIILKNLEEVCKEARESGVIDDDLVMIWIREECYQYFINSKDDFSFVKDLK